MKDGSVTYSSWIRTAYPGVKIMCPNNFVQRVSFCRVTLRWCFGPILYINCINSTNEITQVFYRVHFYATKLNCEPVLLGPVKIKYYHIIHSRHMWRKSFASIPRERCKYFTVPGVQNHSSLLKSIQMLLILTWRLKKLQQRSAQLAFYYCIE